MKPGRDSAIVALRHPITQGVVGVGMARLNRARRAVVDDTRNRAVGVVGVSGVRPVALVFPDQATRSIVLIVYDRGAASIDQAGEASRGIIEIVEREPVVP